MNRRTPQQKKGLSIKPEDVELADYILDQYTGSGRNITQEQLPLLTDMFTDAWFNYGIDRCCICYTMYLLATGTWISTFSTLREPCISMSTPMSMK